MLLVRVEQPSDGNEGRRNLYEQENDSKDDRPVHEDECAEEGEKGDDVMTNHLLIERRETANNNDNAEGVSHEVPASVHKRPNMQVARSVHAVVTVEDGLTTSTNIKHGEDGEDDTHD